MSELDARIIELFHQLDEKGKLAFLTAFESALKKAFVVGDQRGGGVADDRRRSS